MTLFVSVLVDFKKRKKSSYKEAEMEQECDLLSLFSSHSLFSIALKEITFTGSNGKQKAQHVNKQNTRIGNCDYW